MSARSSSLGGRSPAYHEVVEFALVEARPERDLGLQPELPQPV